VEEFAELIHNEVASSNEAVSIKIPANKSGLNFLENLKIQGR
jgi:transaldolase